MGGIFSSIWQALFDQDKEVKLALVGLDGAGKTTIINKLIDEEFRHETTPTIGIDTKELRLRNISIKVFDLAGQENMRNVWKYYFSSTEGIIFVVDSQRHDRLPEVREELSLCLQDETGSKVPILIYANKQDLEGAMDANKLIEELDLDQTQVNKNPKSLIHVQNCQCRSATEDNPFAADGLKEGFEWLTNKIVELDLAKPVQTSPNE